VLFIPVLASLLLGVCALVSVVGMIIRDVIPSSEIRGAAGGIAVFDITTPIESVRSNRRASPGQFHPCATPSEAWSVTWRYQDSWGDEIAYPSRGSDSPPVSSISLKGWIHVPATAPVEELVQGHLDTTLSYPALAGNSGFVNQEKAVSLAIAIRVVPGSVWRRVVDVMYLWVWGSAWFGAFPCLFYALLGVFASVALMARLLWDKGPKA
jgi:hypothetical protein